MNENDVSSDSFEIADAIRLIWLKKLVIAGITILFCGIGLIVNNITPEKWTAQAIILPTSANNLTALNPVELNALYLIDDEDSSPDKMFPVITPSLGIELLLKKMNSVTFVKNYLSSSEISIFKNQDQMSSIELSQAAVDIISSKLKIKYDAKKSQMINISFTASDPNKAALWLNGLIADISSSLITDRINELEEGVNRRIQINKLQIKKENYEYQAKLTEKLEILRKNLAIAYAADIESYPNPINVELQVIAATVSKKNAGTIFSPSSFLKGKTLIEAEITETERELTENSESDNVLTYSAKLLDNENNIYRSFVPITTKNTRFFNVDKTALPPSYRDGPTTPTLLIFYALAGLISGIITVLAKTAIFGKR